MVSANDLKQLAVEDRDSNGAVQPPPVRVFARYILPGVILSGFAGMALWASREQWLPRKAVSVVPVVVTRAKAQSSGEPLFQAPAWVEPRPTPVVVTALAEGVIESLLVVEGESVSKGTPVAHLIDTDVRLAVRQAEAEVKRREAELAVAHAERDAAMSRFEQPVHLDALVAEVESALAQTESKRARLPTQMDAATAQLRFAEEDLAGKQQAAEALSERVIQQSVRERDTALAALRELRQKGPLLDREIEALRRRLEAMRATRELLIEEKRRLAEAEASVALASANLEQAKITLESELVRLDRMTISAPIDGRILQLVARPGTRVLGLAPNSLQDASTVVTMYDPNRLQVRADVRLEDVPQIVPGQRVIVETPSASGAIEGRVLAMTSVANIQKNTLEVKVELLDPPPPIRPEMLTTATFLGPVESKSSPEPESAPTRILVPRSLVEGTDGTATVWIADTQGRARKRPVGLGKRQGAELVEVQSGIQPTDRLITSGREELSDGDRVRIVGEDPSVGMGQGTEPDDSSG